ncbi:MAG TPA: SusC/RagA family TonB-linked outer membrane protein [Gemmatimonadales bacterium]|nr:SusC/RagA family TonB-linked outer membrane protein [Gemmatimonadales bacterium]
MSRARVRIGVLLAALWAVPLGAQEPVGTIQGTVTDSAAQPIQGVTVSIGSRSAVSRPDGRYTLGNVPAGSGTVQARMIGYTLADQAYTLAPGQALDLDIVMNPQAIELAEIVAVGYGEQTAGNITGAVTSVNSDEFNKGRIVNPTELIATKVAGVQVVENNEPGAGIAIRIRGTTSVNAASDPLYVVDGMPLGSGAGTGPNTGRDALNFLNPDDIENITVLRDASMASIYGANAANGVVLITTKTGRNRPSFEYSGNVSASTIDNRPTVLNAEQFRAAVAQFAPQNVQHLGDANTNWFDPVDRTGIGHEHNVAFSSAGERSNFRVSFNYLNQKGIIETTGAERMSLGLNYNQLLFSDRLNLKVNLRGARTEDHFAQNGVLSNAIQMSPTQPITDPNSPSGFFEWPGNILTSPDNPAAIVALATDQATTYRALGNLQAQYSLPFITGLQANVNFGFDLIEGKREIFTPAILHEQQKTGDRGTYIRREPSQLNSVLETYLNYAAPRKVGPGSLELTAGYSYADVNVDSTKVEARRLSTDLLGVDGFPAAEQIQNFVDVQDSKLISFFGRLNYNINDKYLLAASMRRDGSSRFGEGNDWGTFPSVAVAWRLSQEPFLRGWSGLSDLKLRASWAITGNQAFANYQQYTTYQVGDAQTQYLFGDTVITTVRPGAVDANIKWEETRSFDIGLDFGFANQRISGAIDWYDKKTTDLIFTVPVAAGTNLSNFVTTNIGSMRNRGIEFSLSADVLQAPGGGLSWRADFTAARNTNELLAINPFAGGATQILTGGAGGGVGTLIQVLTPGEPVNSFFVYEHRRDANGLPVNSDFDGNGTINDLDFYVDRNSDGVINVDDRRPFHDPAPKWILGHSSYLGYGNLDLSFTLRAHLGNYVYNNIASNLGTYSEVGRTRPYNLHTSVLETGFLTQQLLSDYYVEKASYLRMDNVTLGYNFNLRNRAARVFLTAQNLFTVTGYSGVDPNANVGSAADTRTNALNGIDNNIWPRSRTFTGGLSIRF